MKNLAIECSGTAGSVGMSDDDALLRHIELDARVGSVQTLAPQIDELIRCFGRPDLISVTAGPGSFTGLRVGLSTAKMLGFAWQIPIVPVDSLHAIALRAWSNVCDVRPSDLVLLPVLNAFRGQVFAAAIRFNEWNNLTAVAESICVDARHWSTDPCAALGIAQPANSLVTGPGLSNYLPKKFEGNNLVVPLVAPSAVWHPTAVEVDQLGRQNFAKGSFCDAYALQPAYLRASAAEEKARQS